MSHHEGGAAAVAGALPTPPPTQPLPAVGYNDGDTIDMRATPTPTNLGSPRDEEEDPMDTQASPGEHIEQLVDRLQGDLLAASAVISRERASEMPPRGRGMARGVSTRTSNALGVELHGHRPTASINLGPFYPPTQNLTVVHSRAVSEQRAANIQRLQGQLYGAQPPDNHARARSADIEQRQRLFHRLNGTDSDWNYAPAAPVPIPEEEPLPPAVDETPNPFAHIVPVGDGDVMPLATGNGRTPAPHVNQRVVNYLARRFAARMVRAQYLSSRPAPFGVGYRDLLRIRLIGGILRELGIGTGKQDLKDCDVLYQGSYLTVHAHDVMITFGMVPNAASRDATQKGTWHWYTIAQAIYGSFVPAPDTMAAQVPEYVAFRVYPTPPSVEDHLNNMIAQTESLRVEDSQQGWGAPTSDWTPRRPTSTLSLVLDANFEGGRITMGDLWVKIAIPELPANAPADAVIGANDVVWDVVQTRLPRTRDEAHLWRVVTPEGISEDEMPWNAAYVLPVLDDLMRYMSRPVDAYDHRELDEEWRALEDQAAELIENASIGELSRAWAWCCSAVNTLPPGIVRNWSSHDRFWGDTWGREFIWRSEAERRKLRA
ncbi:hypothetical protein C8Q76DRAFT_695735 [Earliella scabrosa]|nr:hypothetical protein C8Q76DRAFT_695735 [Earliella scabrosa]